MSRRAAAWLAWSACALSMALLVAGIARSPLLLSLLVVGFAAYPTVGALVASRRPENAVGWLLCVVGLLITSSIFVGQYYSNFAPFSRSGSLPEGELPIHLAIFVLLLFPDGRLPSRRWRPVVWLVGAGIALYVVLALLQPLLGPNVNPPGIERPRGVLDALSNLDAVLLGVGIVGAVASVALRLWRSRGEERQQIKWLLFAASVVVVGFLGTLLSSSRIFWGLTLLGFAAMPLAICIAILKYRLYDIDVLDVLINRTLVYGALTALLAAGYVATIMALQGIGNLVFQVPFRAVLGQESALATVGATLAMAALFNPLKRRIQSFIDKRFYRSKYDARKTLEALSSRLRDETDLEALSDDLVRVVRETMQPAHVSLWLHPDSALKDKKKRAVIRESGHRH